MIDSGASIYVASWKDFFKTNRSGDFDIVRMGDEGVAEALVARDY